MHDRKISTMPTFNTYLILTMTLLLQLCPSTAYAWWSYQEPKMIWQPGQMVWHNPAPQPTMIVRNRRPMHIIHRPLSAAEAIIVASFLAFALVVGAINNVSTYNNTRNYYINRFIALGYTRQQAIVLAECALSRIQDPMYAQLAIQNPYDFETYVMQQSDIEIYL